MRAFQDYLLGPLKAVLVRALQQQLAKYIHNIELEELGLMGGEIVLENLELKKDVLHESLRIPTDYDFSRGFIKELRILIPWTRLQSRPIEIKFKTVEIIITPITHSSAHKASPPWSYSRSGDEQTSSTGAAAAWIQQLLTKVLANVSIEVSNLVLKYEDADVVLSAALKSLSCFSANPDQEWTPAYATLDDPFGLLHKLVRASDLTVCLDRLCAPDMTRRRQVQAFEVPVLNRASFDVKLLGCVWLIAPGAPDSSSATLEDPQTHTYPQEDAEAPESERPAMPPSPETSGMRWGLRAGTGGGGSPTLEYGPKASRTMTGVLDRLVGGDHSAASHGTGEPMFNTRVTAVGAVVSEGESNALSIPCVCPLLRDGWTRRPSALLSPFYDGGGVWSRGGEASVAPGFEDGDGPAGGVDSGVATEGGRMPIPTIVADVLIDALCFSLSDLQVQMLKELIDSAVHHVALNASRSAFVRPSIEEVQLPPDPPAPTPVAGSWWPSSYWRTSAPSTQSALPGVTEGKSEEIHPSDAERGTDASGYAGARDYDATFVVASASVRKASFRLLEHRDKASGGDRARKESEEEAADEEETLSISVPVHGLGTVSVSSAPSSARKPHLRPPVAFLVAEATALNLDAHVLPGGEELAADVKVQVSDVVVWSALAAEAATTSEKAAPSGQQDPTTVERVQPIVRWGSGGREDAAGSDSATLGDSARYVRFCLIERARRVRWCNAYNDAGDTHASPSRANTPHVSSPQTPAGQSRTPYDWQPAAQSRCAVQYRLLKSKRASSSMAASGPTGAVSIVEGHDAALGALRVHVSKELLERLVDFVATAGRAGSSGPLQEFVRETEQDASVATTLSPTRASGRALLGSDVHSSAATSSHRREETAEPPNEATTADTCVHLALRSVEVALDMVAGTSDGIADCGPPTSLGEVARGWDEGGGVCVFSLRQLEVEGSESTSSSSSAGWPSDDGARQGLSASTLQRDAQGRQRVCSVSLRDLSVSLVDVSALALAAGEGLAPVEFLEPLPSLADRAFAANTSGTVPFPQRLLRLGGARVNVEILSRSTDGPEHETATLAMSTGAVVQGGLEFLFNASLETLHACASPGAGLMTVELLSLAPKAGRSPRSRRSSGPGEGRSEDAMPILTTAARRGKWRGGVVVSFDGVSVGGAIKPEGCRFMGNMRQLGIGRAFGGTTRLPGTIPSDIALFQVREGQDGAEALSWSVELAGRLPEVKEVNLAVAFSSGTIHFGNAKCAVKDVQGMVDEWAAEAEAAGITPRSRHRAAYAEERSDEKPSIRFDIQGTMVELRLPFELLLEVDDVRVSTRPDRGRDASARTGGGMDLSLAAGDVRVFQALHGVRRAGVGFRAPSIQCGAHGVVTVRPSAKAVSVSLECERVRVRLTPSFCASFGLFVRMMVGPPPRAADAAAADVNTPPESFTFKLDVQEADIDFLTAPCNAGAVSSNVIVGGVSLAQRTTGAESPGAGSKARFEMSVGSLKATQRRDARRSAPALPPLAMRLIRGFVGTASEVRDGGSDDGVDLFTAWVVAKEGMVLGEASGKVYAQPFIVAMGEGRRSPGSRAFAVVSTTMGPRHDLRTHLKLRLAPVFVAFYPPTFRELVSSYNRFASNAFRSFRSRADLPPRRIAVASNDIDIRGCSAVLLASLAEGARGIHVSAGAVTIQEVDPSSARAASPTRAPEGRGSADDDTSLAMTGYMGPVSIAFVPDWRPLLRAGGSGRALNSGTSTTEATPLCLPVDVRWAVSYDRANRCRQDLSLSSVQLYLEQPHFDLCVRLTQVTLAADYPGALPPSQPRTPAGERAEIDALLATSLRLSLLQVVLAMGKRKSTRPPVLEIDVASVRLARGGALTVRHVSVNSWSRDEDGTKAYSPTRRSLTAGNKSGYRVLGRSGHSEDSGGDFVRMEVRMQEARDDRRVVGAPPEQPQLDVVFQLEPFDVRINPSLLRSLTRYFTPVSFAAGSPEAMEELYPSLSRQARSQAPPRLRSIPWATAPRGDDRVAEEDASFSRSTSTEEVSTVFEKSAMTASASMRLLASQVTVEVSSYDGGPALIASTSHVFLRAVTWPPNGASGRQEWTGLRAEPIRVSPGPEMYVRLTRVACSVESCHTANTGSQGGGGGGGGGGSIAPRRPEQQVLTPFDLDVHITRPPGSGDPAWRSWHAGIAVDELSLKIGPDHTRSLELLAQVFLPEVAAAERAAAELSRRRQPEGVTADARALSSGRPSDFRVLERVRCPVFQDDTSVKMKPGQVILYSTGAPRGSSGVDDVASDGADVNAGGRKDGWIVCCEWAYPGLRRVTQVTLPFAPLRAGVPLLEGKVVDALEVELSFLDPLTASFAGGTRFKVPCHADTPTSEVSQRPRATAEPPQPCFARVWRLSWRIPAWIGHGTASPSPTPLASAAWSSALFRGLAVHSSPAGPAPGPSHISATLTAQRLALALLTEGDVGDSAPLSVAAATRGSADAPAHTQEEMMRVTLHGLQVSMDTEIGVSIPVGATQGEAVLSVEVQDFGNFLRLPLLSRALVKWNASGRGRDGQGSALSRSRPIVVASGELRDAVVSVSVTALQCVDRCIGELSRHRPLAGEPEAVDEEASASSLAQHVQDAPGWAGRPRPPPEPCRHRSKRYTITNFTDRTLCFGQVSTTEALLLRSGEDRSYRWRKIPVPGEGANGGQGSRLALWLRLALQHDANGGAGAWTEPFLADSSGTYLRLLTAAREQQHHHRPAKESRAPGSRGGEAMTLPVWIVVTKDGLQTRLALHGEWVFTNHLPQEVQVAWSTTSQGSNVSRGSGEPPGIRGRLCLAGCGPDEAPDSLDPGQEVKVPEPPSYSAVTMRAPFASGQGEASELMLEFRLAIPDAPAVVGSVGPPPMTASTGRTAGASTREQRAGLSRRGSVSSELADGGDEGESGLIGPWGVTRQSDWVEAQPGVHASLISCASPDPASRGFWFWCVASRQTSLLSDCALCASRTPEHRCHVGQMRIDLRPVAIVWNRCSQPIRAELTSRGRDVGGGGGGWRQPEPSAIGEATCSGVESETRTHGGTYRETTPPRRARDSLSPYRPSGWMEGLQPGGRMAVCQHPFMDYDLALSSPTEAAEAAACGPHTEAQPFLVSVPSEILSRRCSSRWLPLHSRALLDNVLCPLVVVASRQLDAHWPSLSLRVFPGFSVQNHLPVPLSVRAVFAKPLLDADGACVRGREELEALASEADAQPSSPLLVQRVGSVERVVSNSRQGGDQIASLTSPDAAATAGGKPRSRPPSARVTKLIRAEPDSRYSAWEIFDSERMPVSFLLPTMFVELGLDSTSDSTAYVETISQDRSASAAAVPRFDQDKGYGPQRTRPMRFSLEDDLSELVLIPWGRESKAVLPCSLRLERELVLGGVELIRLEVHPRVVFHNATGFPLSFSLLERAALGDETEVDTSPTECRMRLESDGSSGKCMTMLAFPQRARSSREERGNEMRTEDAGSRTASSGGLRGKLSRFLGSAASKVVSARPDGFSADLLVQIADDCRSGTGTGTGEDGGRLAARGYSTVVSFREESRGAPLRFEPSTLDVAAEGGRRAMRIRVALAEDPPSDASPTRHVLLHHPVPSVIVANRSAGPVTLLFDCGTLMEVERGCTAEHMWGDVGERERERRSGGSLSASPQKKRPLQAPRLSQSSMRAQSHSRGSSDASGIAESPSAGAGAGGSRPGTTPRPLRRYGSGSSNCAGGTPPKAQTARRLGGDAILQHWFQCKNGLQDGQQPSAWSDPLWVARGVQIIRLSGKASFERSDGHGGVGEGWGFPAEEADEREVRVHVMERAGGFVMSFAEGGFDDGSVDADDGSGGDVIATETALGSSGVVRDWASTAEQHVVLSVSGTTIQLLDETNLHAVPAAGHRVLGGRIRDVSMEGPSVLEDWIGGTWDGPSGLSSDGASAHLPAAVIPAILSVYIDASSARLWRAAPLVQPVMSTLDLERSCHLKSRVGIDVCLGTLQIDNRIAGASLPVLFCFRKGSRIVDRGGDHPGGGTISADCHFSLSLVLAEPWERSGLLPYAEKVRVRSAPIDVCLEDALIEPLLQFTGVVDGSMPFGTADRTHHRPSRRVRPTGPQLPPEASASLCPRLFIQRVDIGALVVRATVQGHLPGKQMFLSLDKTPLLFNPVVLRGVFARPDEIAEQIASNYAMDAMLRSLAVVGSLEALGSPTTLLSEWGKGVYDLFAMPINAIPQGPSSTVRATFRGLSSLLRHASAGTLSSLSGVTNALSRNLGGRGGVVRPIAGTMGLVHRTSRSLIASTGVESEWGHAEAATRASPALCRLNADLWYRWCLLPPGHEFVFRTPAFCSDVSYSQATVPVSIVLSSKAVFLYQGASGCENLWKKIEHQDITLVEHSVEHAPIELILNARAFRRPLVAASPSPAGTPNAATSAPADAASAGAATDTLGAPAAFGFVDGVADGYFRASSGEEQLEVGGLLMKIALPTSACCRELARLLHGLTDNA